VEGLTVIWMTVLKKNIWPEEKHMA